MSSAVTLSENQAKFGTDRLRKNGVPEDKGRILCSDYRDIPKGKTFTKIVTLEMAEHVGVRKYSTFLQQVYDLLDDDGTLVFQVAGIRPRWQFEDILWGIFVRFLSLTTSAFHDDCVLILSRVVVLFPTDEQVRLPRSGRLDPS